VLGAVGLYGVMAYLVTVRRREFGVRMALGANRLAVLRLVLREAAMLALRGAVIGGIAALGASQLLRSELHGLRVPDPAAFGLSIVTLSAAVLAASIVPAWRATRTALLEALRAE
jgi:ABC-type antimicrobial peptide transport system permease subunit